MKLASIMTGGIETIAPHATLAEAAKKMASQDIGSLPVCAERRRVIGIITDRDITVRAVAEGRGPDSLVRDAMTDHVDYCFEDQDVEEVTKNMASIKVRRLPVLNRDKRLVGIISLGDIAQSGEAQTDQALGRISRPGGEHTTQRA